mgnify:CR=1 FL=1
MEGLKVDVGAEVPFAKPDDFKLGFLVNLGTFLALAHASSLTLKAATCVRNAALVWIGSLLGESVMPVQVLGYAISVCGFLLYSAERAPVQGKGKQKAN